MPAPLGMTSVFTTLVPSLRNSVGPMKAWGWTGSGIGSLHDASDDLERHLGGESLPVPEEGLQCLPELEVRLPWLGVRALNL